MATITRGTDMGDQRHGEPVHDLRHLQEQREHRNHVQPNQRHDHRGHLQQQRERV